MARRWWSEGANFRFELALSLSQLKRCALKRCAAPFAAPALENPSILRHEGCLAGRIRPVGNGAVAERLKAAVC